MRLTATDRFRRIVAIVPWIADRSPGAGCSGAE